MHSPESNNFCSTAPSEPLPEVAGWQPWIGRFGPICAYQDGNGVLCSPVEMGVAVFGSMDEAPVVKFACVVGVP
jgi:hypothetical protein